jgi:hypothetical protein
MAEKGSKKAKRKPAKGDADSVLASLPATRPNRMSARHRDASVTPVAAKAKAKPAARKDKAKAVKAKAKVAPTPIAEGAPPRPKGVRSASENLVDPAKKSAKKRPAPEPESSPSGTELVTTVVQAAGELAQVGLSIGGQVLKRAVDRIPRP